MWILKTKIGKPETYLLNASHKDVSSGTHLVLQCSEEQETE